MEFTFPTFKANEFKSTLFAFLQAKGNPAMGLTLNHDSAENVTVALVEEHIIQKLSAEELDELKAIG